MLIKLLKMGAAFAALFAMWVGLVLFSPILTRVGFYRWIAEHHVPFLIGFTPAQHYGIPWAYTFEELSQADLSGQTAIVTGSNSGVGYQAALALARQGAHVTLACRNPEKCKAAANTMRADIAVKGTIVTKTLDTSTLASVQTFAKEYRTEHEGQALDILMMNAGTALPGRSVKCVPLSQDGIDVVFETNYVGHHLLYKSLEPMLQISKMARVIHTSSAASMLAASVPTDLDALNDCTQPKVSYRQSKLAQIMWVKAVTKRLAQDSTIYANAFHPGLVDSGIWDKQLSGAKASPLLVNTIAWFRRKVMWTSAEGALAGLYLAVPQDLIQKQNMRGQYFHPQGQPVSVALAEDPDLQDRLWNFSEELVRDFLPKQPTLEDMGLPQDKEREE